MERVQVYVSFNDGEYRIFKSYESITVDDSDATHFRVECHSPERTLFFNKGSVKFIDTGPVHEHKNDKEEK